MTRTRWPLVVLIGCCLAVSSGCAATRSIARRFNPDAKRDFDMRLTMAQVHEQEGKLQKAAAAYAALHAEKPKHAGVAQRYGIVQIGLGKEDEGILLLEKANLLDPENPAILNDLGYAYLMSGDIEQGEALLREAYELDPRNKRTVNNLALAAGLAGRYDECRALYEQVMTKAEAQANLGYICAQRGEGQRAAAHYSRALDLDPSLKPAAEALVQLAEMKRMADGQQRAPERWAARQTSASRVASVDADNEPATARVRLTGGEQVWAQ